MNHKIRLGILGGGGDSLIGVVHRIAAHMFDYYQIVGGCFNPNPDENKNLQHILVFRQLEFTVVLMSLLKRN